MKKIITIIFVLFSFSGFSQTKAWTIEAFKEFILTNDSLRATTQIDANDTIVATKQYVLNTAGAGNGWDSLTWNETTGDVVWWYAGTRIDSINTDNRYVELADSTSQYLTPDSINSLISSAGVKSIYTISLPAASTVAGRVSSAVDGTDYETGWTLAAGTNPANLDITHGLGRRIANVKVHYNTTGTIYQQARDFQNAYSAIFSPDNNSIRIEALYTGQTAIEIHLIFAE